jgi:hypothetical protein
MGAPNTFYYVVDHLYALLPKVSNSTIFKASAIIVIPALSMSMARSQILGILKIKKKVYVFFLLTWKSIKLYWNFHKIFTNLLVRACTWKSRSAGFLLPNEIFIGHIIVLPNIYSSFDICFFLNNAILNTGEVSFYCLVYNIMVHHVPKIHVYTVNQKRHCIHVVNSDVSVKRL